MAEDKKSFILYCDIIHMVEKLPADKAGDLFKHILRYVNDQDPETDDIIITIAFEPIKQALKRDLRKYESYIEKQRVNGKRGGRPRKTTETQETLPFFLKPKKADSVIDSVIDSESEDLLIINHNLQNPISTSNNSMLSYQETLTEFLNATNWQETLCMLYGLKLDFIQSDMQSFLLEQNNQDQFPRQLSETKRHYTNKIKKQVNNKAEEARKSKRSQSVPTV